MKVTITKVIRTGPLETEEETEIRIKLRSSQKEKLIDKLTGLDTQENGGLALKEYTDYLKKVSMKASELTEEEWAYQYSDETDKIQNAIQQSVIAQLDFLRSSLK